MKRILSVVIVTVILTLNIFANAYASENIKVNVDGQDITFTDSQPIMENDRVLIPIRAVFEDLAGKVSWDGQQNKVTIEKEYMTIELTIGNEIAYIHRKYDFSGIPQKVKLDVASKLVNNRTYVPIRFVAESLGMVVSWDNQTQTVIISKQPNAEQPNINDKVLSFTRISSDDLKTKNLIAWFNDNRKNRGVSSTKDDLYTYILASAGEKPTGGYKIEITSITKVQPDSILVNASISSPKPDTMVTQAITYPYMLVKIEGTNYGTIFGDLKDNKENINKQEKPIIDANDVKSIILNNMQNEMIKEYPIDEFEEIVSSYNDSKVSDLMYPMMIVGSKMMITLNDEKTISFISYGSDKYVVATSSIGGKINSYHLECPYIASILLDESGN